MQGISRKVWHHFTYTVSYTSSLVPIPPLLLIKWLWKGWSGIFNWADSLILAIPNNSGQLDRCMVTCLTISHAKCVGYESQASLYKVENGCWKNAPQRYCESFIKIISPQVQKYRTQTWNINKNFYTWDLSLQGSHMFLDVVGWERDYYTRLWVYQSKDTYRHLYLTATTTSLQYMKQLQEFYSV